VSADRLARILVIDDDREVRALLRAHFADRPCVLFEASNGAQGIESVIVESPDLVILDVMMPELNGWEVARYIRSKDELAAVRILMLTGIGERMNALTSPLYGADAALDKPFRLDALDEKIAELLAPAGLAWA
jgi:DNA-binding response OmpR family regulator